MKFFENMSATQLQAWINEPERTAAELASACGRFVEVDRQLAVHHLVSAEALRTLGSSDDAVCRSLSLKHPNFPVGDRMKSLIKEFPESFFENPALNLYLFEFPGLLEGMSELLDANNCPDDIILWFIKNGSLMDRQRIFMNGIGSHSISNSMSVGYFQNVFEQAVESLAVVHEDPIVRGFFDNYCQRYRNCAFPSFMPQDRSNQSHRRRDMIGGFPFTSDRYPWPKTVAGHYMQPIVQIDIDLASQLLEEDIGSGLLQIWAPVFSSREERLAAKCDWGTEIYLMRVISKDSLGDNISEFYPHAAPWLPPFECVDKDVTLVPMIELSSELINNSLIKWHKMSPMLNSIAAESHYQDNDILEYLLKNLNECSSEDHEVKSNLIRELIEFNFNTPEKNVAQKVIEEIYIGGYGRASEIIGQTFNSPKNEEILFSLAYPGDLHVYISIRREERLTSELNDTGSTVRLDKNKELWLEQCFNDPG